MARTCLALLCLLHASVALGAMADDLEGCVGETCDKVAPWTEGAEGSIEGMEMLQMASAKMKSGSNAAVSADLAEKEDAAEDSSDDAEEDAAEDSSDDAEDEDEEEEGDDAEAIDDASEEQEANASQYLDVPLGEVEKEDTVCRTGRGTSCYSPRSWIRARTKKTLKDCNNMCARGDKGCKFFFYGTDHCGLCSKCDKRGTREGYTIYKKYFIDYPVKNAVCKERQSSKKRLRSPRGCKKRAKKLSAVAWSYKSKQCVTWNKCSETKKSKGWVLQKTR